MRSKRTVKQHRINNSTGQNEIWYEVKLQRNKSTLYFVPCVPTAMQLNSHQASKRQDQQQLQDQLNSSPAIDQDKDLWEDVNENQHHLQTQQLNISANQQNKPVINYRPEIDGIRAIAILLVVFYHAFPSHLPGGFIGVDVFFVISGFLITQIITKQVIEGKFSLLNFYCRRVKRIYPALILMLCFSLWIISKFTQIDLVNFSIDTLNAALVFCANLGILSHKQDYFDADIRGNPLLHLWSLGVEEQFYIIWPFLIMLVFKCCRQRAMTILTVFTLCSFVFSIICVNIDSKLAFYFPLCRFWQMSVGGMLGYAGFRFRSQVVNNLLSTVGLMVILVAPFVLNDESLFPGFWALLPTLGCAFIIQAKNESFLSKYVLSCKLLTFVGKISYSLYLWHWPLIVYSRVMFPHGSTSIFSSMSFMVGLAFGLSILTYFLAENPIRKVKNNKIVFLLLVLMVCIGLAAVHVNKKATQGYFSKNGIDKIQFFNKVNKEIAPQKDDYMTINGRKQPNFSYNKKRQLPTDTKQVQVHMMQQRYQQAHGGEYLLEKPVDANSTYADMLKMFQTHQIKQFAVANNGQENRLFLIGDSHLEKISYRFQELFRRSQIKGTLDRFPTVLAALRRGVIMGEENSLLNFTRELVKKHKPKRILFVWNWIYYFCKDLKTPMHLPANCDKQLAKSHIFQFINFVLEFRKQGIEVYTNGVDINHLQYLPENMFDGNGFITKNLQPFKYSDFRRKYQFVYDLVEGALNEAKINWIDTADNLCWEDVCHVVSPKGYAPFTDIDHMGKYFSSNWFTLYDHLVDFE